jgi:hypothetical protein
MHQLTDDRYIGLALAMLSALAIGTSAFIDTYHSLDANSSQERVLS